MLIRDTVNLTYIEYTHLYFFFFFFNRLKLSDVKLKFDNIQQIMKIKSNKLEWYVDAASIIV